MHLVFAHYTCSELRKHFADKVCAVLFRVRNSSQLGWNTPQISELRCYCRIHYYAETSSLINLLYLLYYVIGTNYEVTHCGAFTTPHSHSSWSQILLQVHLITI